MSPLEVIETLRKAKLPSSEVFWRQEAPGIAQCWREVVAMGKGEVHGDGVFPTVQHRRSMHLALSESTGWGTVVADYMPASSEGLPGSRGLLYAAPKPIVTSDVRAVIP